MQHPRLSPPGPGPVRCAPLGKPKRVIRTPEPARPNGPVHVPAEPAQPVRPEPVPT